MMEGATMYCKVCGHKNEENAQFCTNCGEKKGDVPKKNRTGVKKPTIIIGGVFLAISVVIIIFSNVVGTINNINDVISLVRTGEEESLDQAKIIIDKLNINQRTDAFKTINSNLMEDCKTYIDSEVFSKEFYESIANIGRFLNEYDALNSETINSFPGLEVCYKEILENETDENYTLDIGEKYIDFLNTVCGVKENVYEEKIFNAINARKMYEQATMYFNNQKYEQAFEICSSIECDEADKSFSGKVTELKNTVIQEYGMKIPIEVQSLLDSKEYEKAWELIKESIGYFKDNTEIIQLFEEVSSLYIQNLIENLNFDAAANIVNESLNLVQSEQLENYKKKLTQPYWKLAYENVLRGDAIENEFCLYSIENRNDPILIMIRDGKYKFVMYDTENHQLNSKIFDIDKYDKENDVFYNVKTRKDKGEYHPYYFTYPDVFTEEWAAYTFDGTDMVYAYSLKKKETKVSDELIEGKYTFKDEELGSSLAYDAQLLIIKNSVGLDVLSITDENIESVLFN